MEECRQCGGRFLVWLVLVAVGLCPARGMAAGAPLLQRVPKTVTELYLPEEQQAGAVGYGLYARLSEGERGSLVTKGAVAVESGALSPGQARILAAWFNSARWGCDPPREKLEAEGVRGATLTLSFQDNVVELSLQGSRRAFRRRSPSRARRRRWSG